MKTDIMLSTKEWEKAGQYLTIKGHQIFVIDENSNASKDASQNKDTILLIHGFPTSSWDWVKIWPRFSSDYRLIAMDMLGFGLSDKPNPHDYSIHEQADIVEGIIQQLGLTHFHVLAHDYGDTVAQLSLIHI